MTEQQGPVLIFAGKEEKPEVKPCVLIKDGGYGDTSAGNLLIHGDNLPVLAALAGEYKGGIKCAYLDPPYNTGATFAHYGDSLPHSEWLCMMKSRLEQVRTLLTNDGVAAVQIGFDEMAYLKVLMDEIFGRGNCVGQIAVRMSHSAGLKRRAAGSRMIKNTEYILLYYNESAPRLHALYEPCAEYPVNYYHYITEFPEQNGGTGRYCLLTQLLYDRFPSAFSALGLKESNSAVAELYARRDEVRQFILQNKDRVVRKDSNVPGFAAGALPQGLEPHEFISSGTYFVGKNAAGLPYQLYSLSAKVRTDAQTGVQTLTNLVGDWWDGFYRDMSRVDIEGGVLMKTSKKPERLIQWLLTSLTEEGDLVLDPFLGSGTTAAVAMKMRRRFIGIEAGDQFHSLCVPRLKRVVDGDDPHGITAAVNWPGGSGFRQLALEAVRGIDL